MKQSRKRRGSKERTDRLEASPGGNNAADEWAAQPTEDLMPEESTPSRPGDTEAIRRQRELSRVIHGLLTLGLGVSVAAMLIGMMLDVTVHREFSATVPPFRNIIPLTLSMRPSGLFALGLLTLIATPVLRVIGSFFTFLRARDIQFAGITFFVLIILFLSFVLGRG